MLLKTPLINTVRLVSLALGILFLLPQVGFGQSKTDSRWYFGNSNTWLNFNAGTGQLANDQVIPYGAAGSVVATDPIDGSLLFYSDGKNLITSGEAKYKNPDGTEFDLGGDNTLAQPVQALAINQTEYIILVITQAKTLKHYQYNTNTRILTTPTEPSPALLSGMPTGNMELIRLRNGGYAVLVATKKEDNTPALDILTLNGNTLANRPINLPDIQTGKITSLAYQPQLQYLAIGQEKTTNGNPLALYKLSDDANSAQYLDTLGTYTSQLGDIVSLSWKRDRLFATRNTGNTTGQGIYRIAYNNTNQELFVDAIANQSQGLLSHDLKTGPDGRVYYLYQTATGRPYEVGYLQSPLDNSIILLQKTLNADFTGNRFSRMAAPPKLNITPAFTFTKACTNNPVYLYPDFENISGPAADKPVGLPDSISWEASGFTSTDLLPVIPAELVQTGLSITLTLYYPSGSYSFTQAIDVAEEVQFSVKDQDFDKEIQDEIVLCPSETKTLILEESGDSGGGGSTPPSDLQGIWYKPKSVFKFLREEQVIKANSIILNAQPEIDPITGEVFYPVVGTYYVLVSNDNGCEVYKSFTVVVRDDEDSKTNRWYFGNGAGIDFTYGANPIEAEENQMRGNNFAPQGTSMAIDENIYPLFYTNGDKLWVPTANSLTDQIAEATVSNSLLGDRNGSQNSIFKQVAPDPTLYYLLTIGSGPERSLYYTIADLKGNGNANASSATINPADVEKTVDGAYILSKKILGNVASKIAAGEQASSEGWVVTHEIGTNRFITLRSQQTGLSMPQYSSIGEVFSADDEAGYMAFSPDLKKIASVLPNRGVELVYFNDSTGLAKDTATFFIPANRLGGNSLYGVAFSDDILLISHQDSGTPIYAINVSDTLSPEQMLGSITAIAVADNATLGAMQRGPDGRIYVARAGQESVGAVEVSADNQGKINGSYTTEAVTFLGGATSQLGLPNLVERASTPERDPYISVVPACEGEDVAISLRLRYNIEVYKITLFNEDGVTPAIDNNGNALNSVFAPTGDGPPYPMQASFMLKEYDPGFGFLPSGNYVAQLQLLACDVEYPTDYTNPEGTGTPELVAFEFTISGPPVVELREADGNLIEQNPDYPNVPNRFVVRLCKGETTDVNALLSEGLNGNYTVEDFDFDWYRVMNTRNEPVPSENGSLTSQGTGLYQLIVTNKLTQCGDTLLLDIEDNRPEVDLADGFAMCRDEDSLETPNKFTATIDHNVPISLIEWRVSVNGSNFGLVKREEFTNPQVVSSAVLESDTLKNGSIIGEFRFSLTVTDQNGCFRSDTTTYNLGISPVARLDASGIDCANPEQGAILTASITMYGNNMPNPYTYKFYREGNPIALQSSLSNTVTVFENGNYYVVVTDNYTGCEYSTNNPAELIPINFEEGISYVKIDPIAELCDGAVTTLYAITGYDGSGTIKYEWRQQLPDGTFNGPVISTNQEYTSVPEGTYQLTVSLAGSSCASNSPKQATYTVALIPDDGIIDGVLTICPSSDEPNQRSSVVRIRNVENPENYTFEWRKLNDDLTLLSSADTLLITSVGEYIVKINDCPYQQFTVLENCTPTLIFPNAIAPSGRNNEFSILNKGQIGDIADNTFEIFIYNRWGEVIYTSTKPDFRWSGQTINGKEVATGTYAYLVRYKNRTGADTQAYKVQRGGVTVFR